MERKRILLVIVCLLAIPLAAHGREGDAHPAGNALIQEMIKLDQVFREIVSAVAVDDAARVRKAVESMHGYREKTDKALHQGAVHVPKNSDRIGEFIEQDEQFHAKLGRLEKAAAGNDQQAMVTLTKQLLDGCVQCHKTFRNP